MLTAMDWIESRLWLDLSSADIDAYVRDLRSSASYDVRAKLAQWHRDGYVVFEGAASSALIDELTLDVGYLFSHSKNYELDIEIAGTHLQVCDVTAERLRDPSVKLNSIHALSLAAAELSLTDVVVDFLAHVFREPPTVLQSLTFFRGSEQAAHMDYPYVRRQTKLAHLAASWIALEDVHPDAGPLIYYPGSHKLDVCGFYDWGSGSIVLEPASVRTPADFAEFLNRSMAETQIPPVAHCPKKGDVFIWHGRLVHGGSNIVNVNRSRQSYVTHYTSLSAHPQTHRKPDAIENSAGVFLNGGFAFDYPWLRSTQRLPSYERYARADAPRRGGAA